ncbi:hypothetical protein R84981_002839 [Carnimonas sp. R-84981]|uniref:hypothetical protein n=1 Tax=Carnimonas bestiolae TaxID=3402172 RepID=UPI003EDC29E9
MSAIPKETEVLDFSRMPLHEVKRYAYGETRYADEARSQLVERIIDLDLQYREDGMERGRGWSSISPTELIGQPIGGGVKGDQMATAYEKGIRSESDHDWAHRILESLPPRRMAALLISRRKRLPNRYDAANDSIRDVWCREYEEILPWVKQYCRLLGMKPEKIAKVSFKDERAIRDAAKNAKIEIILALSA